MGKTFPHFSYQPGRSVEDMERERLLAALALSYEERFKRMMDLIRLQLKLQQAKDNILPRPE